MEVKEFDQLHSEDEVPSQRILSHLGSTGCHAVRVARNLVAKQRRKVLPCAVAVFDGEGLTIIYHNIFAAIPLPVELFTGLAVRQFTLGEKQPGEFDMWQEVGPTVGGNSQQSTFPFPLLNSCNSFKESGVMFFPELPSLHHPIDHAFLC